MERGGLHRIRAAEPAVAADGAGITAFRRILFLQPAPLLNVVVRLGNTYSEGAI